jgi:hypothetical protein
MSRLKNIFGNSNGENQKQGGGGGTKSHMPVSRGAVAEEQKEEQSK